MFCRFNWEFSVFMPILGGGSDSSYTTGGGEVISWPPNYHFSHWLYCLCGSTPQKIRSADCAPSSASTALKISTISVKVSKMSVEIFKDFGSKFKKISGHNLQGFRLKILNNFRVKILEDFRFKIFKVFGWNPQRCRSKSWKISVEILKDLESQTF